MASIKKQSKKIRALQANNPQFNNKNRNNKASFLHSTNDQMVQHQRFTPPQQNIINQLSSYLQPGAGNLALPGNNKLSFEPIRQNALNSFNQKIVPSIAERFQSLGGAGTEGGATSSGALQQQTYGAGADLSSQLAALEAQYGLQQQGQESNNYFNLLQQGLAPQFDYGVIPGQQSGVRQLWNGVKGMVPGAVLGGLQGGPAGAALGAFGGLNSLNQQRNQPNNNNASITPTAQGYASGFNPINTPSGFNQQNYQNPSFNNYQGAINDIVRGYQNNSY